MVKQPMLMKPAYICALVVGAMLLLALLSAGLHSSSRASLRRPGALRSLLRDSARHAALSDQDSNALISMLNATYSMAYANAARKLASDRTLRRLTNIDAAELANAADAKQQRALAHINAGCPDIAVHSDQLRYAGWLE